MPLIEIWKEDDAYLWDACTQGPDSPLVQKWLATGRMRLVEVTEDQWDELMAFEDRACPLDLEELWNLAQPPEPEPVINDQVD